MIKSSKDVCVRVQKASNSSKELTQQQAVRENLGKKGRKNEGMR